MYTYTKESIFISQKRKKMPGFISFLPFLCKTPHRRDTSKKQKFYVRMCNRVPTYMNGYGYIQKDLYIATFVHDVQLLCSWCEDEQDSFHFEILPTFRNIQRNHKKRIKNCFIFY